MRLAPPALLVFLATTSIRAQTAAPPPSDSASAPSSAPSPSPTPRYRLIPYGFESAKERSTAPLLRFDDEAEVRSLEMNAAIARFFDRTDDRGNMLRGATPGGAPTLREMASYRPHVTPALDLLGAATAAIKEIKKAITNRKRMPAADPPPSPTATPMAP